jgi:hypothetical protein
MRNACNTTIEGVEIGNAKRANPRPPLPRLVPDPPGAFISDAHSFLGIDAAHLASQPVGKISCFSTQVNNRRIGWRNLKLCAADGTIYSLQEIFQLSLCVSQSADWIHHGFLRLGFD